MAVHATQPMARRPRGQFRVPGLKTGERVRVRVLTDCNEGGPHGGIPAYFIHPVPNPNPQFKYAVEIPCFEEKEQGLCWRVKLRDGTILHKDYERKQRPVVVVWNYAANNGQGGIQILDLTWPMYRSLKTFMETPEYGDPRLYDIIISCSARTANAEDGRGQTERTMMAVGGPAFSQEFWAWVQSQLPAYEAHMEPQVEVAEVAQYLGGELLPEGSVTPGMAFGYPGGAPGAPGAPTLPPTSPTAPAVAAPPVVAGPPAVAQPTVPAVPAVAQPVVAQPGVPVVAQPGVPAVAQPVVTQPGVPTVAQPAVATEGAGWGDDVPGGAGRTYAPPPNYTPGGVPAPAPTTPVPAAVTPVPGAVTPVPGAVTPVPGSTPPAVPNVAQPVRPDSVPGSW